MSKSNPYAPSVIQAKVQPKVDEVETAPDGSVAEVMSWVGDDTTRAKLAYDKEIAGNGRKSLLAKLRDLLPNEAEGDPAKGEPTVVQAEDDEIVDETTGSTRGPDTDNGSSTEQSE